MEKVHVQSEDIVDKLKEKGFNPGTSTEEYLCFLWDLYQIAESKLQASTNNLEELKLQQAEEMKEVESYVAHIRSLTEEREALTTDFEKENIQLRIELEKLQIQQDSQLKEVEEMLDQEGLNEIAHSSPSEQIAYLLVERATLLEKLELLEQKVDSRSEHLSDQRQDELEQIHRTLEEELYQQQETMRRTKETLNKEPLSPVQKSWKKLFGTRKNADRVSAESSTFDEELDKERKMRASAERDLTEAAQRLKMAHDEIRKLTDDLLIKKKELNELEQIMQTKQEDTDALQRELTDLRDTDSFELQKAKEHNSRLDKEILALRQRVRSLDSERKKHMEQCEKSNSDSTSSASAPLTLQDNPELHKKCKLEVEEKECQKKLLQHKLQKLHSEYEDIVERNEELESILGESQNRTKEQVDYLECEIAGLQRTIMNLEAELTEMAEQQEIKEEMLASAQKQSADIKKMSDLQQELESLKTKLKEANKDLKSKEQENHNLRVKNEQLEREAHLQGSEVSDLQSQCKKLQMELSGQKPSGDVKQTHQQLQDKIKTLEKERETMSSALSEHKKKCEILQRQFHEEMEEVRSLREENLQLRQEVTAARQDLQSKREENSRFKQEVSKLQDLLSKPPEVGNGAKPLTGDSLIQQQYEEIRQLRQDLHRVQNVCSSAEKELRYERDKNLDIKKQHILLQKENTKLTAELNQVKQKLAAMTATCTGLEVDLEQRQHVMKEMELELLKRTQSAKALCSWQEKLDHERCRATEAEKLVLELEQQLRASQHQVLLLETQNAERRHLEEELKKTRENEAKLKVQLQDEQLKRKIKDQNFEELQLEIKALHDKEISLTQNNCALQLKLHQLESVRQHMNDEKMSTTAERTHLESTNQRLLEELSQVQEEKEQLHKEYDKLSKQLDDYIRKYNERQLRYKAKLSQAKDIHLSEGNQKDLCIKQLEMELAFSRSQAEKEQQWISRIRADNENLHEEKRHLLQKVTEYEASDRSHKWKLLSVQNRADILDEENRQLQESLLQLYNQVASLERVLKKLQSLNLADITKVMTPERLLRPDAILNNSSSEMESASSPVMSEVIDATKRQQSPEIPMTLSLLDTLEVGYLNVASPGIPISSLEPPVTPEPCTDNV